MHLSLSPLTFQDRSWVDHALSITVEGGKTPLATWAFPPHYIWNEVLDYRWSEIDGWWCLFAEYVDGVFMPLPPLGPRAGSVTHAGDYENVVSQVMEYMKEKNLGRAVTRIENVPSGT